MNDEERLIRALNELSEVAERNRQKQEEDRKCEAEAAERRKRLKEFFYKKSAPITMHIPRDSSLVDLSDE